MSDAPSDDKFHAILDYELSSYIFLGSQGWQKILELTMAVVCTGKYWQLHFLKVIRGRITVKNLLFYSYYNKQFYYNSYHVYNRLTEEV